MSNIAATVFAIIAAGSLLVAISVAMAYLDKCRQLIETRKLIAVLREENKILSNQVAKRAWGEYD